MVVTSAFYIFLQSTSWRTTDLLSTKSVQGTSVDVGDQGDQPPELPEPGDVGIPQQEPSREKGDQGDQPLKPPTPLKEPSSKEPKVPAGSKDPQVEVDEVKGSEVRTEEYDRECEACNHFFSSNIYRYNHVTRYHKALLRRCKMCMRLFMFPWDFDRHLDSLHSKCKVCQQCLVNEEMLLDHMDLEHPTVAPEPVVTEDQVTEDPVTLEADCQDCQVKCKHCDRHFKNVAECNMHVNRRHKKVKCPQCENDFVKQADCDNHVRDVYKFVCSISGYSVFKYNKIELHEHLRYDHRSKMVFRCNKCVKVFSTRSELHQHHKVDHGRVKLAEMQGGKFPCPRCSREFLSESMLVNHSRDHKENIYGCNECPWHFNTVAGLIKHCQDTHDDRHFACTTCGEVFASNPNLCKHTQSHHIKICHLCHRIFVSDDKLFDHMKETHLGSTGCSREELIKGE